MMIMVHTIHFLQPFFLSLFYLTLLYRMYTRAYVICFIMYLYINIYILYFFKWQVGTFDMLLKKYRFCCVYVQYTHMMSAKAAILSQITRILEKKILISMMMMPLFWCTINFECCIFIKIIKMRQNEIY